MGQLHYGPHSDRFYFEDRLLSHLKIVITSKLRRGESFLFSWDDPKSSEAHSIWLSPSNSLYFEFDGHEITSLNRAWAEVLSASANSGAGLTLIHEPANPDK